MPALFENLDAFLDEATKPNKPRTYMRASFDPEDGHLRHFVRRVMGVQPVQCVEIEVERFVRYRKPVEACVRIARSRKRRGICTRVFRRIIANILRFRKVKGGPDMQRTLILLKPDCVQRRLVGDRSGRFEQKGLRLVGLKLVQASAALAEKHYAVHKGKPFYDSLLQFLTAGPTVALVLGGARGGGGGAHPDGPDRRRQGAARHHPRRLRHQRAEQPRPRQRQRRERQGRDRPVVQAGGVGGVPARGRGLGRRRWFETARVARSCP